ncbi:hypothetical protein BJX70DRAFT_392568 [Aspergillus crustosus]
MPEMAEMPVPILSPCTVTPTARHEGPPVRNSCGNCNQSKVKCSKERPNCRRCLARNTPCTYAVSMRGVKRTRTEQPIEETGQPEQKKRAPELLSPTLSDILPDTGLDLSAQPAYFSDWNNDLYGGSLVNDNLGSMLPFNTFDPTLFDQAALAYPLEIPSSSSPPTQAFLGPQIPLPSIPNTLSLSPITPPRSRDGASGVSIASGPSPRPASNSSTPCCCQQTIAYKLTEFSTPKPPSSFNLDTFLAEHRANMALCMSVLDCADLKHRAGMLLLMQLISLLFHMVAAFDQILMQGEKTQSRSQSQSQSHCHSRTQSPNQIYPTYPPTPPPNHRKEQVVHANLLRAELAKLGAMIQQFDRRYCSLDNTLLAEDTFLLSPLFVNLQWKTQAKFDAVRSWMPWL